MLKVAFPGKKKINCKLIIDWNEWRGATFCISFFPLNEFSGNLEICNKLKNIYSNKSIEISKLFLRRFLTTKFDAINQDFNVKELEIFSSHPSISHPIEAHRSFVKYNSNISTKSFLAPSFSPSFISRNLKCIWDSLVIFQSTTNENATAHVDAATIAQINRISIEGKSKKIENVCDDDKKAVESISLYYFLAMWSLNCPELSFELPSSKEFL